MVSSVSASITGNRSSINPVPSLPTTSSYVETSVHTNTTGPTDMPIRTPDSDILRLIYKDCYTWVMGCIIGAMFVLTLIVCIKTRVAQRKQKRFGDHREHVSLNVRPSKERAEENNHNENEENETNDHENYAMVKPTEKCYVDLEAGEYDLLRSQRKHVQRPAEAKGEPCYDHFLKPNSLYDMTGESERKEVFHPDYEYEIVKNINKKKSDSKNLEAVDPTVAPNIKRNTGYENTKSRNPRECVTQACSQNGLRVKSTFM